MTHTLVVRLLSPTHRRIVYLDRSNPRHGFTLTQLAKLGWTFYNGPARVDAGGWVIGGTDPAVDPRPIPTRVVKGIS